MINTGERINMKVKVANITFSKNKKLREILNYHFTDVTFNDLGKDIMEMI